MLQDLVLLKGASQLQTASKFPSKITLPFLVLFSSWLPVMLFILLNVFVRNI
jgi:hypothetical protein